MKPRSLRHRLEKAAKLLVIIQKHLPDVDCRMDEDKGQDGHVVVDFNGGDVSRGKVNALGKDLEGRGYRFSEKKNPWLGQKTYHGKAADKPSVILTLPITIDRLAINEDSPERSYSFAEA